MRPYDGIGLTFDKVAQTLRRGWALRISLATDDSAFNNDLLSGSTRRARARVQPELSRSHCDRDAQ